MLRWSHCGIGDSGMVVKIFQNSPNREAALQRIGAAAVLQWSSFPASLQDALVQQALALSDDQVEVHREIERLTRIATGAQPG
jgi:hypothetical protein